MGKLVEQTIRSLFNGVSRQPHSVRLPNQIEESDNAMPSVVTSGFEKRPPTEHVAIISGLNPASEYGVATIDRDATERYLVVLGDNTLRVYDAFTGSAKTVTVSGADATAYLTASPDVFKMVSVADYTFIVNTSIKTKLGPIGTGSVAGTVQTFTKLPTSPTAGQIYKVTGDASTNFDDYYVRWDGSVWVESVKPDDYNSIDATTMPYQLVRNADGSFTFSKAAWTSRIVGDSVSVEAPKFINRKISDIFFHRGRLGLSSDEGSTFSQAGDVFNFWPDKATDILDSDPIEVQASSSKITLIRHAVPFRKTLFMTADNMQFEVGNEDKLTPKTAVITPTTSYQIDPTCRPVGMGDQLYFASRSQGSAVIYEYYYDGDAFSNTAADVTKHCLGYIPSGIHSMAASTATQRLFVLSQSQRDRLYVYTSYWNGKEKAQSAWGKYTFDGAYIMGMAVMSDYIYLVMRRNGQVVLERLPVDTRPNDAGMPFAVLLDRRVSVTGVYDSGTNKTTWTVPYNHGDNAQVVKGTGFPGEAGRLMNVSYPTTTTVTATGNHSQSSCVVGVPYVMTVELSRQYLRDGNNQIVSTGRLQLRRLSVHYRNSGFFKVKITPDARDTNVWSMTGRLIGAKTNAVGVPAVSSGQFMTKVLSRGDTTKIEIVNDSPLPCTITGVSWDGFYNNIAQQG